MAQRRVGGETFEVIQSQEIALSAGDDELNNWKRTINAGVQDASVYPLQTAAGPMPNSSVALGANPKIGDYLRNINFMIFDATKADVYLEDGLVPDLFGGTSGTAPSGTDTLSLVASVAPAASINSVANLVIWFTFIPNGAVVPVKWMKSIKSHAASSGTTFSPVLYETIPAGAAITGWGVKPKGSAWQIRASNQDGRVLEWGKQSIKDGGYRISVGAGVAAYAGGQFNG